MVGSIDPGGLIQRGGHRLEVAHHDDEIVHVHGLAQDDGPLGARELQGLHHHVFRHNARIEEHHDDEEDHEYPLANQLGPGQGVGRQDGQQNVQHRTHQGDEERIENGGQHILIAEQHLVVDEGQALGKDIQAVHAAGSEGIRQRPCQNVQQRHHHGQGQQKQDRHQDELEQTQPFCFLGIHVTTLPLR